MVFALSDFCSFQYVQIICGGCTPGLFGDAADVLLSGMYLGHAALPCPLPHPGTFPWPEDGCACASCKCFRLETWETLTSFLFLLSEADSVHQGCCYLLLFTFMLDSMACPAALNVMMSSHSGISIGLYQLLPIPLTPF